MTKRALIVSHVFSLRGADPHRLTACLNEAPGVESAQPSRDEQSVRVSYDLKVTGLDEITSIIAGAGGSAAPSLLERIRLSWIGFTERNARDQALAPVRDCCNKPPGGT